MSVANIFSAARDTPIVHRGTTRGVSTSTATWGVNLTVAPKAGDFIFVQVSGPTTSTVNIATSGYTTIALNSFNTSVDSDTHYYYKISDGTETRVEFAAPGASVGAIAFISVFSGVDNTNPLDVTPVTSGIAYPVTLSYRALPDIYPVTEGSLIIKSMHTPLTGDPTSVTFHATSNPRVQVLNSYSYPTPTQKSTAIIATTTNNDALKSFGAVPNVTESYTGSFAATSIAVALRPA
jgi:hypothetical protein